MPADSLVAFFAARLDEIEEAAKELAPVWAPSAEAVLLNRPLTGMEVRHIALHDPARVLRDVEADRKLLAKYATAQGLLPGKYKLGYCEALEEAIAIRAGRFSGHPEYDQSWRP